MKINSLTVNNSTAQFELDKNGIGDTLDLKIIKCARRKISPSGMPAIQGMELLVYIPVFECYATWWLTLSAYRFSKLDIGMSKRVRLRHNQTSKHQWYWPRIVPKRKMKNVDAAIKLWSESL